MNNTTLNLAAIGYSNYNLSIDGRLYRAAPASKEIKRDKINRFYIIADNGTVNRITLKELYRQAYHKEFCIDNIQDLPQEEWKEIEGTDGKYYISSYGRVKSLQGYTARILQPFQKDNGYLIVKINGKNILVHRLVAFAFCENNYEGSKIQIHHKDQCRTQNHYKNLEILSAEEHKKRHKKKETIDNEKILS